VSPYASFEVTPAPARPKPEPTAWDEVDWFDGPTLVDGFWQRADRPDVVGAVLAKEVGR